MRECCYCGMVTTTLAHPCSYLEKLLQLFNNIFLVAGSHIGVAPGPLHSTSLQGEMCSWFELLFG